MLAPLLSEFTAASRRDGTRTVLSLDGELDCVNEGLARAEVEIALEREGAELVIDLRGLTFMDPRGVHVLLHARELCARLHRRLRLVPAPPRVQRVLALCNVLEQFDLLGPGERPARLAA